MANITKRTNKDGSTVYKFRAFVEENADGKQKVKSMTWRPPANMRPTTADKEAEKQATLFEDRVRKGYVSLDGNTKFAEYAAKWLDMPHKKAKNGKLAPKTRERYESLLIRINEAIGHKRLDRITSENLESFYQNLAENGIKEKGRYAISDKLKSIIKERKLTVIGLAEQAGAAPATIAAARDGKRISVEKAMAIATALQIDVNDLFEVQENTGGLADKTILHHHALICAILEKARKSKLLAVNVAKDADAPVVEKKEATYLDKDRARYIVELLLAESDIRKRTAILLLFYSGVRRGELCGLEWRDIDFENRAIHIKRASQYQRGNGITEVTTKNDSSMRAIELPDLMFFVLNQYRLWWNEEREKLGDKWQGDKERLFIQWNGKPINPDTINFWVDMFIEKHNIEKFTPHSCRHTFCSLQVAAGIDIKTVQIRSGHSQASTLLNIYSHKIKTATEAASDTLNDELTPKDAMRKNSFSA